MPAVSHILAPVVFSARCQDAVRYAAALACRLDSDLTLLHVFVPMFAAYAAPEGYATPPQLELDSCAHRLHAQLDEFLAGELRGLRVRREISDGDPAQAIAEFARAEGCSLIAMPTHGYGPFRRFLLGSVTAKVLHDACCPVFTGPHMEHPPAKDGIAFRRVLCAVDLGPQTRGVLEWAGWFAAQFAAPLTVVHALPQAVARAGGIYFDPQWRSDLASDARCRITAIQQDLQLEAELRIVTGDPPAAVREAAEEAHADLVVVGRGHARHGLARLRANAYAILRESPCPVVAI
jgi:nucleotide-binding universal stress UspA family protein